MGTSSKAGAASRRSGTARAPRGCSLHIGLNTVDPRAYSGWDGPLSACEFDARDMAALATAQGLQPRLLLTRQATRAAVLARLRAAARALRSGDLFVLTYSGHGGQVPDPDGDEADRQDETWCLYDGQLIDDELHVALARFAAGVRVLVLSDSCHSGTVTRALPQAEPRGAKRMPAAVAARVHDEHRTTYRRHKARAVAAGSRALDPDAALAQVSVAAAAVPHAQLQAAVILVSGCQDSQTSLDGERNGAFTEQVLRVWNGGAFRGNHTRFHACVRSTMPATQTPHLYALGDARAFLAQRPFTV